MQRNSTSSAILFGQGWQAEPGFVTPALAAQAVARIGDKEVVVGVDFAPCAHGVALYWWIWRDVGGSRAVGHGLSHDAIASFKRRWTVPRLAAARVCP